MKNGFLIALEGIDGSGKSTQATLLKLRLERMDLVTEIVKAKEASQNHAFSSFTSAFDLRSYSLSYMFAYQALHCKQYERTIQALQEGKVVIADRWNTSYFIYHNQFGELSKRSKRLRREIDNLAFNGLKPTLAFFLDVTVTTAFERRSVRGDAESFSDKERNFYEEIRSEYMSLIQEAHWRIIDGEKPIEKIHQEIFASVSEHVLNGKS